MILPDTASLSYEDKRDGVGQQMVAAIVVHNRQVLLLRRSATDSRGGVWEPPTGKVEPGEDLMTALFREVNEETALVISEVTEYLGAFDYISRKGRYHRQHTWSVAVTDHENMVLTEHDAMVWTGEDSDVPLSSEISALIRRAL